jgi:hypothetical protein
LIEDDPTLGFVGIDAMVAVA